MLAQERLNAAVLLWGHLSLCPLYLLTKILNIQIIQHNRISIDRDRIQSNGRAPGNGGTIEDSSIVTNFYIFRLMTVPIAAASAKNAIRQDLCIAGNGAVLNIYGHLALRSVVKDIGQNVRDPF